MSNLSLILIWIGCVIVGAAAGFLLGFLLFKLGFVLIGSAVALVGAGMGGIVAFLGVLKWSEDRDWAQADD